MAQYIYQHRRGTTENWATSTIIPYNGEIVVEETADGSKKLKVGDGNSVYSELPYLTTGGGSLSITDDGEGNVTIDTTSSGVSITDDGNGNVTIA